MAFRQPPEWAPHGSVWIGFPSHAELWEDDLAPAQAEVAAFARAVHADGAGERVVLVAADAAAADIAPTAGVDVIVEPFGDIWLRDTGPIILKALPLDGGGLGGGDASTSGALVESSPLPNPSPSRGGAMARDFAFNGWGGKYDLPGDDTIGARLAATVGLAAERRDWILEGGAIDVDGSGLAVTTKQCLLNPNRNPGMTRADVEARLAADLGLTRILWLGEGLLNDHTDGHVDNLARFVAPNRLAIPVPGDDDPNAAVYADARARAEAFGVEVVAIPSPGRIEADGEIVPASYMNFYIGNAAVVVPIHGAPNDDAAVAAIAALFPGRRTVGLPTGHILTGGGSFHCISQQVPSSAKAAR